MSKGLELKQITNNNIIIIIIIINKFSDMLVYLVENNKHSNNSNMLHKYTRAAVASFIVMFLPHL